MQINFLWHPPKRCKRNQHGSEKGERLHVRCFWQYRIPVSRCKGWWYSMWWQSMCWQNKSSDRLGNDGLVCHVYLVPNVRKRLIDLACLMLGEALFWMITFSFADDHIPMEVNKDKQARWFWIVLMFALVLQNCMLNSVLAVHKNPI